MHSSTRLARQPGKNLRARPTHNRDCAALPGKVRMQSVAPLAYDIGRKIYDCPGAVKPLETKLGC